MMNCRLRRQQNPGRFTLIDRTGRAPENPSDTSDRTSDPERHYLPPFPPVDPNAPDCVYRCKVERSGQCVVGVPGFCVSVCAPSTITIGGAAGCLIGCSCVVGVSCYELIEDQCEHLCSQ
jgi:hypothetical protein